MAGAVAAEDADKTANHGKAYAFIDADRGNAAPSEVPCELYCEPTEYRKVRDVRWVTLSLW